MPRIERRVVITGLGLVTPLGIGVDPFWASLSDGRGAVGKIRAFPVSGLPNDVGGEVLDFDDKAMKALAIPRLRKAIGKSLKYMARDIQLSVAGAQIAMVDSGLSE